MTIMEHVSIKTLYHLLCCMLLFISAMCALAQEHEPIGAQDERLSTLIHQRMQEAKVPALSVSVTIKGVRQRFVYGVADVASQKANTLDTVYELGSMSKAFTGLVVQILIQEGRLRQGDDIITYLPEMRLNYQGKPASLTVADCLFQHWLGWKTLCLGALWHSNCATRICCLRRVRSLAMPPPIMMCWAR